MRGHRVRQRRPGDELGDQVGRCVRWVGDVQDLGGAEPGDPAGDLRLPSEPGPVLGIVGEFRADHLHRDQPARRLDSAQVDSAHPALAQPGQQLVPAQLAQIGRPQRATRQIRQIRQAATACRACRSRCADGAGLGAPFRGARIVLIGRLPHRACVRVRNASGRPSVCWTAGRPRQTDVRARHHVAPIRRADDCPFPDTGPEAGTRDRKPGSTPTVWSVVLCPPGRRRAIP